MIMTDFKNFPQSGRLLGIDWGARRVGVAVSTPDRAFIFAHPQLANSKEQLAIVEIKKIINAEKIVGIVIGLPLHADGTDSETTRMVREFAEQVSSAVLAPVAFIEENLTSVEAGQRANSRGQRANLDSEAAAVILENAIAMIKRTQK